MCQHVFWLRYKIRSYYLSSQRVNGIGFGREPIPLLLIVFNATNIDIINNQCIATFLRSTSWTINIVMHL